ncbi:MAG: hypothetical protein GZ090_01360 [Oxalobacteraceae bacterium]|nr:hypothetical protein [Oxalobacteraceae bacterium]
MANLYRIFKDLLPEAPLLVGTVMAVQTAGCEVELPTGGIVFARGTATVGQQVFVRDGVVEGVAPTLTVVEIEI